MGWLKKVLSFVAKAVVRPGIDVFLNNYIEVAKDIVTEAVNGNPEAPFHNLKPAIFQRLKDVTAQSRDTWISILVDLAFETLKATRK